MFFLQMSLSGAVLITMIVVIRAMAVNLLPKRTFLILWGIALIRLLIPVSLPSGFSIYSLISKDVPALQAAENGAEKFHAVFFAEHQNAAAAAGTQVPHNGALSIATIFLVWLTGVVVVAGVLIVSYLSCRREFKTSLPVSNDFVDGWLSEHSLRRRIEVRQLTGLSTPLTYGVFRPVILMPKKTDWQNYEQVQYALFHEYVHIRRFDSVSKLIAAAALCVHWFNPMVWVLYVLFNRDIELACDECVVRRFGHGDRAGYARALISMEEQRMGLAPLHNYFAKNAIEERITAIMKMKKKSILSLGFAALLVAGTTAAFATTSPAGNTDEPELMPGTAVATAYADVTVTSYVNAEDGKTYYSTDGGKTFEPVPDEEYEIRFSSKVEWWTYDEYKAWLEKEKVGLQELIGEKCWTSSRGEFVWTQEIVDETVKMYEGILEDIKNGALYSKTVDGSDDVFLSSGNKQAYVVTMKEDDDIVISMKAGLDDAYDDVAVRVKPILVKQDPADTSDQVEAAAALDKSVSDFQ